MEDIGKEVYAALKNGNTQITTWNYDKLEMMAWLTKSYSGKFNDFYSVIAAVMEYKRGSAMDLFESVSVAQKFSDEQILKTLELKQDWDDNGITFTQEVRKANAEVPQEAENQTYQEQEISIVVEQERESQSIADDEVVPELQIIVDGDSNKPPFQMEQSVESEVNPTKVLLLLPERAESTIELEPSAVSFPSKSDRPTITLPGFKVMDSLELQKEKVTSEPFLLEPFIPSIGLSVLASRPDVGKSQFCRQLALEIENGSTSYVGLTLSTNSNTTLVICTEDALSDIKRAVEKQQQFLGYQPKGLIYYAVGETEWNLNKLLEALRLALTSNSFDLVVIDGYGDLFDGADMNSITDTRKFLNKFDLVAKQAKTSILFNHHMTKASYNSGGNLADVQGSGGILQKPRAVFTLTKVDKENRILRVLKGNTAPNEYKTKGVGLKFSEDSLTFSSDSGLVDLPSKASKTMDYDNLYTIAEQFYSNDKSMSYTDVKKEIEKVASVKDTQAKTYRSEMKKLGIILEDEKGEYFLNPIRKEVA